jgi:hypothetical protein
MDMGREDFVFQMLLASWNLLLDYLASVERLKYGFRPPRMMKECLEHKEPDLLYLAELEQSRYGCHPPSMIE